jgi:hypothetical protein
MKRLVTAALIFTGLSLAAVPAVASTSSLSSPPATVLQEPHLVIVFMENNGLWAITAPPNRAKFPYLNSLWASPTVDRFTQSYAVSHPSLPNYIAVSSGTTLGLSSDSVAPGRYAAPNVWDQLTAAGISWGVYQEGMPSACSAASTYNDVTTMGQYALRHNPGTVFSSVFNSAECQQDQPLSAMNLSALPAVSFVTPNICHDFHGFLASDAVDNAMFPGCLAGSLAVDQRGDSWLAANVPAWISAGATVIITADEGGTNAGVNGTMGGGQLYTVELGAGITGGIIATQLSHYSILAAIEDAYNLPLLGNAATASPLPVG